MDTELIFGMICLISLIIIGVYYLKRRRRISSFLTGAATGLIALFITNKYGSILDINLPLNTFNICGSVFLGSPFVVFLVIMNYL